MNLNFSPDHTRKKGSEGEDIASEHLISLGYSIISRNYQARNGEIDIIAEAPDKTLVFAEVKSAQSGASGHPAFWVTKSKQQTIARMAQRYLMEHNYSNRACRFDVVTIYKGKIEHFKNAFFC